MWPIRVEHEKKNIFFLNFPSFSSNEQKNKFTGTMFNAWFLHTHTQKKHENNNYELKQKKKSHFARVQIGMG